MTVVLDTNVLVAALVAKGLCHEVVLRALGSHNVATSPALLDELERTLRGRFTLGPAATAFLAQLRPRLHVVTPAPLPVRVSRDAGDDRVLAAAVEAKADVVVTGDQDLLVLGVYEDIRIVAPREFLSRVTS